MVPPELVTRGLDLIPRSPRTDDDVMEIRGRVHNGVVVLDGELTLPEGTVVTVSFPPVPGPPIPAQSGDHVRLPLVPSAHPGSRRLTAERMAELLEEDDVPS